MGMPHSHQVSEERRRDALEGQKGRTVETTARATVEGVEDVSLFPHLQLRPAGVPEVLDLQFPTHGLDHVEARILVDAELV